MRTIAGMTIAFVLATASLAFAHAGLIEKEAAQAQATRFTLAIPHGCGTEATLRVRVRIPTGIVAVKPMPKAGWALKIVEGTYAEPQTLSGSSLTQGVVEIIWSGSLPDAHYDEFVFRGTVTEDIAVGARLYIPAVQECASGVERWIEIPKDGGDGHHLDRPAPSVKVTAPGDHHH